VTGFAYYAPAAMADRTWYLYWIAVEKAKQGLGIGRELLQYSEGEVRSRGGRIFLIETSSLPVYEPTRRFYKRHNYEHVCTLADFYADGDDLVVFSKRLLERVARRG
jgi:ribosomal protein S18 acetylase RimI-like enzyme